MGGKWFGKQCFPLFGKRRKKEKMENLGENFPPGPTNFFPPKSRGKLWRENCSYRGITQMPSPTYPPHKHNSCSGIK